MKCKLCDKEIQTDSKFEQIKQEITRHRLQSDTPSEWELLYLIEDIIYVLEHEHQGGICNRCMS